MQVFNPEELYKTLQKNAAESSDPLVHQVAHILGHQAIAAGARFELNNAEQLRTVSDALGIDESTKQKEQSVLSVIIGDPATNVRSQRGSYTEFFNEIGPTNGLMLAQVEYWRHKGSYRRLQSLIAVGAITDELIEYGERIIDSTKPVINLALGAVYSQALKKELKLLYTSLIPFGVEDKTRFTQADELARPPQALWRYLNDREHGNTMPIVPIKSASLSVGQLESGPWYSSHIESQINQTYQLNKVGVLVLKKEL